MASTFPPAGGPGAAPSAPGPVFPKAIPGQAPNPGATPALSPGGGAGNRAAGVALIKTAMQGLIKFMASQPPDSHEFKAVNKAISALIPVFGKSGPEDSLVPAGIQQMGMAAKTGGPLASAPAPGLQAAPPPGGGPSAMAA